jgi:uncharacterized surface protein with fasciclin (FAS1) repeats
MDKHRCNCCGQPATKECSGCGLDVYCGIVCQKEAWPAHKEVCDNEVQTVDARFGRKSQRSIPTYLESTREFRPLYDLLVENDLISILSTAGPFTLFAPTKNAISNFISNPALNRDRIPLDQILKYHVVAEKFDKKSLRKDPTLSTVQTSTLAVKYNPNTGALMVGDYGTEVTRADIKVKNGIIHRIDAVLVPPRATY